jgi:hypothetical protein
MELATMTEDEKIEEIKRLREALVEIIRVGTRPSPIHARSAFVRIARAALRLSP